jgi:cell division protein FtsL
MTDFQPSGYDRRAGERRALLEPIPQAEGWHLDKKVPLTLIFTILVQAAMVIWAIADIKKDVELLKQDAQALHVRDNQNIDALNTAIKSFTEQYTRLDAKLDRLIERTMK